MLTHLFFIALSQQYNAATCGSDSVTLFKTFYNSQNQKKTIARPYELTFVRIKIIDLL
jgi:hypothetical protein